jgi:glycine cleavage system H lipoate-binding protein/TusA-related sulfurtransferase
MKIDYCEFPEDVLYDFENNVWAKLRNECAELGITSVYASFAGKLIEIRFIKPEGSNVIRGQTVATIESVKYFGAVRTPLSGTITKLNDALKTKPRLSNDSPYDHGWFVRVKPAIEEEMKQLHDIRGFEEKIRSQIRELRVKCFKAYPDYDLWEIGVECAAVLVRLNELIENCEIGDVIHIVSDDPTADIEIVRWSDQTSQDLLESRQEGKLMHFLVRKVKG